MEPFVWHQAAEGPAYLRLQRWEQLDPALSAGFTGRQGGVSAAPLSSLNCALHVQDDPAHVVANRQRLAAAIGVPWEAWTCGEQVHGDRIVCVTAADRGKGRADRADAIAQTDALITREPDIWLTSFYADCVPIYFWDPVQRAVGLAHAGWKGTVAQIARKTIEAMKQTFGSRPEQMRTAIGPSIRSCCYEVDDNVKQRVETCMEEWCPSDEERQQVIHSGDADGKWMLNLQELNRQIMIKAGILPSHIEICEWCTGCRTDLFFSHRKEQGATGRMVSWIGLHLADGM